MKYMKNIFHDWQTKGTTSVLHEKRGGYANNTASIYGLANKAESFGVRILTGTKVTGFKRGSNSKAVTGVVTSKGTIECEQVIVGAGPWIKGLWDKLELPKKISIKDEKGKTHKDYPMWIYWMLTEGVLGVDPNFQKTDDGKMPPVIHVDSDAHLFSDVDGSLITDKMWGVYYKPDFNFNGVQGGAAPYKINKPAGDVNVDPYGVDSIDHQSGDEFAHMWCSALAHCQKRFKGKINVYKKGPSGGLGCFTPDSFPVFDRFCENVYIIADSNHGYKMIGVGDLVSDEILGKESSLLKPFRFNRYAKGKLHPVSNSPFPWS
jgi:glycine/D-amino acid oxidase-like deaminating enzyme